MQRYVLPPVSDSCWSRWCMTCSRLRAWRVFNHFCHESWLEKATERRKGCKNAGNRVRHHLILVWHERKSTRENGPIRVGCNIWFQIWDHDSNGRLQRKVPQTGVPMILSKISISFFRSGDWENHRVLAKEFTGWRWFIAVRGSYFITDYFSCPRYYVLPRRTGLLEMAMYFPTVWESIKSR
jgi:hypothetical protein